MDLSHRLSHTLYLHLDMYSSLYNSFDVYKKLTRPLPCDPSLT